MDELCQALAGAVLPDNDDDDASLLSSLTSHAAHATTGDSNAQGFTRAVAPARAPFAFESSWSLIRVVPPRYRPGHLLRRLGRSRAEERQRSRTTTALADRITASLTTVRPK